VIYTTNAIESLNYNLRKVTRNRGAFPTSDAAMKLVRMALQNISRRWTFPRADLVEKGEDVLFLGVVDVLLHAVQTDHGVGAEELGKAIALRAHVAHIVLRHVQDVLRCLGIDRDFFLPEESLHPALLLVVEGHGAGGFLPDIPRDLPKAGDEGGARPHGGQLLPLPPPPLLHRQ